MLESNSMREYVEHKVQQIKNDYLNNYERVIADYEREVAERQSYHGRELLELLQNADDEMRGEPNPKAKISFDGKTLIVSNNGRPFHEKGVSSLMLSNLSPKRKDRQLIGNKGTGFRSILSWADSIRIDSGDLHISFSSKHSQQMLYNLYNGVFPEEMTAATLAFPQWIGEDDSKEFTTTITIKIKNDSTVQNDIENQIDKLNPEILIFLNNIRELEIVSTRKNIRYIRSFKDDDVILDTYSGSELENHQEWKMFRSDDNRYGERMFSVVIAYNKAGKMPQNNVLHAYFPTKVEFPFPVLLHADFELDAHRNQLKEDPANDCILKRAAELLVETAINLFSNKDVSFAPIKFLIPTDSYSKDLKDHNFESYLTNAIKCSPIFPTVNNKYVCYSPDLKFYKGALAFYVYGDSFEKLIKYSDSDKLDDFLEPIFKNNAKYSRDEVVYGVNKWIEQLPRNDESLENIISFVDDMLTDDDIGRFFKSYYENSDPDKNFKLFFDKNYKLMDYSEPKFITGKIDVIKDIPSFIHYNSIHPVMEECINGSESILEHLDDLHIVEYKFVDIIESANNTILDTVNSETQTNMCNELLQWTYVYSDYIKPDDNVAIYLPTREGPIEKSNKAFFGKEYGNKIGENIVDCYLSDCFIIDIREIIGANREEAIGFLKKLGVSMFPRIIKRSIYYSKYLQQNSENAKLKLFAKSIIQSLKYPLIVEGDRFSSSEEFFKEIKDIRVSVNTIDEIEDILSFAETKDIIAWIKEDAELRDILYNPRELSTSTISLRWKTQNKDRTLTCSVPSYLHFVFSQEPWIQVGEWKYRIDACLLSSEKRDVIFESLVFPNVGEYVSDLGGKISKHKDEYTSVLKNLGMKSSFSDLPVEKIYEVLAELPNIPNSGTIARNFYEAILEDNSRKRILEEISLNNPKAYSNFIKNGKVFCRNGKYINVADVSYISKKDVCESILDTVNILNVSGRVSYKFIPQLLGVKELRIQGMKLIQYDVNPNYEDFLKDFDKYKALAFTYRVNAKQDPKPQARLFSRLEIVLCSNIQIEYKNHPYDLIDGEYYHERGDRYYLCCSYYNKNVHRVRIGSGIASIICAHLDLVDDNRTDFRELYIASTKDDRIAILRDSFDEDTIQKARQLMNSDEDVRDEFISAIDQLSSKELSAYERIIDSIDFEDITSQYNSSKIISLFKKLEIDVEEFNKKADLNISLIPYYKKEIERITPKFLVPYMNSWYYRLQNDSLEHKTQLQYEFLKYDDLCKDIKIRNSVYFNPEKELVEQLSINDKCPSVDLVNLFRDNKKLLIEKIGDDLYLDDFLSKPANASLLYYAEFDELCKRYTAFMEDNNNADKDSASAETEQKRTVKYVNVTSSPKTTKPSSKSSSNQKHSYSSTGFKDNKKNTTRIGRAGEKLVYDELLNDPKKTFVRWVSENAQRAGVNPEGSSSAGYDMEYIDENGKRCYVEVKSTNATLADGISFHLSAFEYRFAIDNSEAYYIYYVTEVDSAPKISILFDVFKESEFNSENYSYMVGEYIVSADIVHSENTE